MDQGSVFLWGAFHTRPQATISPRWSELVRLMVKTPEKPLSIEENCKIALGNTGQNLKPADTGAIAALIRTARLCDSLFDMGETKDLAPLLSRLHAIMESLQMTPRSRSDQPLTETKAAPDVKSLSEIYLRLVSPEGGDQAIGGPKPRTPRKSTNGTTGRASNGVAKVRPRSGPKDKQVGSVQAKNQ